MQNKILDDFGVETHEYDAGAILEGSKYLLGVQVRTRFAGGVDELSKVRFTWRTKRGTTIHLTDFRKEGDDLVFMTSCEMHESFLKSWPTFTERAAEKIAMTFADYCHRLSDGTTQHSILEVDTKVPSDCILGDLTWCLPSKFADDLIDALYVMNSSVLEGILEQSILIGPFVRVPLVH